MDYILNSVSTSIVVIGIIINGIAIFVTIKNAPSQQNKHFLIARYCLVCKEDSLKLRKASLIVICCIILCICISITVWFAVDKDIPKNILSDWIAKNHVMFPNIFESTEVITVNILNKTIYPFFSILVVAFIGSYAIIIFYVKKYTNYMNKYSNLMSTTTVLINRQFIKLLAFQSSVPVIVVGLPMIIAIIMVITGNIQKISAIVMLIMNLLMLVPCINSILFLVLPTRNRKYLKLQFRKFTNFIFCKTNNVVSDNTNKSQKNART
uniref:G-protein coupled receptors family 1 profile domain-containing protein n=1 Tax=Strongyloides venezuelensis TaxID=75913 RepID=A0A0K0F1I6_STRVS